MLSDFTAYQMTTIKNSIQIKSFLRKYYQHDFYVEKDKRVKGEKVYVFTKSVNLPVDFLKDLKIFDPSVKINHNKILLSAEDWKKFIEYLPENKTEKLPEVSKHSEEKREIPKKSSKKDKAKEEQVNKKIKIDKIYIQTSHTDFNNEDLLDRLNLDKLLEEDQFKVFESWEEANQFVKKDLLGRYGVKYVLRFKNGYLSMGDMELPYSRYYEIEYPFTYYLKHWFEDMLALNAPYRKKGKKDLIREFLDQYDIGESLLTSEQKEVAELAQAVMSELTIDQLDHLQLKDHFSKATYENPYFLNKAIEKFLDERKDQKTFTSDEKLFIRQYTGYGGLEKYGASGKELLYEYFTPVKIIQKMWELAYKNGYQGGPVLEPAMGIGDFLRYVPKGTSCTGYEINPYSHRIATILYPKFELHHAAFETRFIKNNESLKDKFEDLPKFDLVIGNPPYGEFTGKYAGMGEKSHTRAITYVEYFILRGLQCLNPGGLLLYIIGVEVANGGIPFLQQGMTKAKEKILELGELQRDTYRLCNGLFDRTDVLSEIVLFKRK